MAGQQNTIATAYTHILSC